MCQFCPKCGRLAEYDPYYERTFCTSCSWRGERKKADYNSYNFIKSKPQKNSLKEYEDSYSHSA